MKPARVLLVESRCPDSGQLVESPLPHCLDDAFLHRLEKKLTGPPSISEVAQEQHDNVAIANGRHASSRQHFFASVSPHIFFPPSLVHTLPLSIVSYHTVVSLPPRLQTR